MSFSGTRPRATHRRVTRSDVPRRGASLIDTNRWAWSALRRTILIRDRWVCAICGGVADSVDHIIPRARGGGDDPQNLRAVCARDQNPDARPAIVPFGAPKLDDEPTVGGVRRILGELTLRAPRIPGNT